MIVKRIDFEDFTPNFRNGPFVNSHGIEATLNTRILRLETMDGDVGYGEIVRSIRLDPARIGQREIPLLDAMAGKPVAELPSLARRFRLDDLDDMELRGIAFGLETAYLDLIGRRTGQPLYALLGGRMCEDVPDYYSLGCVDPGVVAAKLAQEAAGWEVVQIKLGADTPESDKERVLAALAALNPNQKLLADFNGALSVEVAVDILSEVRDPRLLWEEPCYTFDENTEAAHRTGAPVLFDQCLKTLDLIARASAEGVAAAVCVKPAPLGGLSVARAARDLCIDVGMPMRIDGPWCGHIATAACLHLAVGAPAELIVSGCDLRQPLELDDDWGGTRHLPGHRIAPSEEPGHGAVPDTDWRNSPGNPC